MKTKYIPILVSLVLVLGIYFGKKLSVPNKAHNSKKFHSLEFLISEIENNYVDSLNWKKLEEKLIESALDELDPHSYYIPPVEISGVNDQLNGHFGGIGVEYRVLNDTIVVLHTMKDGPASSAGLTLGDRIIGVNELMKSDSINNDSLLANLKGKAGETISINFIRNKKEKEVELTRSEIPLESVSSFFEFEKGHYYIRLNRFSHRSYKEFSDSLRTTKKIQKLTIDLRDNGGGSLQNAVDIAGLFLDDNQLITYTEGANQKRKDYRTIKSGRYRKVDVDVWVNENSASASEILAGCLQHHKKATIIGRNTFGKGLVQQQFDLPNNGGFRLVIAKYFTPAGICIQRPYKGIEENNYYDELADSIEYGIHPDIEVPIDTLKDYSTINKVYTLSLINSILDYTLSQKSILRKLEPKQLLSKKDEYLSKLVSDKNLKGWEKIYLAQTIVAEITDLIFDKNEAERIRLKNDEYFQFINNLPSTY